MRDHIAEDRSKIYNVLKSQMERTDKESTQHKLLHHCSVDIKDIMITGSGMFLYLDDDTYYKVTFGIEHIDRRTFDHGGW